MDRKAWTVKQYDILVIYLVVNYDIAWIILILHKYIHTVYVYTLYIFLYIPYKGTSIFNLKKETIKTRSFSKSSRRLRRISSLFALGAVGDTDWKPKQKSVTSALGVIRSYAIDLLEELEFARWDSEFFGRFKMNLDWRFKHSIPEFWSDVQCQMLTEALCSHRYNFQQPFPQPR